MVEHGSIQPDGIPTPEGTLCDMMMHMSPLLAHVLSMRNVEQHLTNTEGTGVTKFVRAERRRMQGIMFS